MLISTQGRLDLEDYLILIVLPGVLIGGYAWHRRRLIRAGRNWKKRARRYGGDLKHDAAGWIVEPDFVMTCEVSWMEPSLSYFVTSTGQHHALDPGDDPVRPRPRVRHLRRERLP